MQIKKFWIVTKPTRLSVLIDICFETTPAGLARQGAGGLKPEDIHGMYTTQAEALTEAQALLDARPEG